MNPVRKLEMQCTHAEFFRQLPVASSNLPYEVIGDSVVLHDHGREIHIHVRDGPIRYLASLALPIEEITLTFPGYDEAEATKFMDTFLRYIQRGGG